MKILYAVQCTGNGHLARAQELLPILEKYGQVDVLASGTQSQIGLQKPFAFKHRGISLFYAKNGALSYAKTFLNNSFIRFLIDVIRCPLNRYDFVINDFEPITAWKSIFSATPILSLSHQGSLLFDETPMPAKKDRLAHFILRYYAPVRKRFGFHFNSYHPAIFTPVIRQKIRQLTPRNLGHYVVYLPSYSNALLLQVLAQIPEKWVVFTRENTTCSVVGNCAFYPINETDFLQQLADCEGVLCNAGFELPAESLFLQKKLFVIPIKNQYEQSCNAQALHHMGVTVSHALEVESLFNWIKNATVIKVNYPDISQELMSVVIHSILFENNNNDLVFSLKN